MVAKKFPTSAEVLAWPEFKALCERLGVAHELPTTLLTIQLEMDEAVKIQQIYLGEERTTLGERTDDDK